jgi:hypothetical protein
LPSAEQLHDRDDQRKPHAPVEIPTAAAWAAVGMLHGGHQIAIQAVKQSGWTW